jgi:hypothetical protein
MYRCFVAVVVGLVLAGATIVLLEKAGRAIYPRPDHVNPMSAASMRSYVENAPMEALALVPTKWFLGTLVGAWFATRTARRFHFLHALLVGLLMVGAGLVMLLTFPAPGWMIATTLVATPIAMVLGYRAAPKRRRSPPVVLPVEPRLALR